MQCIASSPIAVVVGCDDVFSQKFEPCVCLCVCLCVCFMYSLRISSTVTYYRRPANVVKFLYQNFLLLSVVCIFCLNKSMKIKSCICLISLRYEGVGLSSRDFFFSLSNSKI